MLEDIKDLLESIDGNGERACELLQEMVDKLDELIGAINDARDTKAT